MQDTVFETQVTEECPTATHTLEKQGTLSRPSVEAAVGMSRKWDARQAGREVAETAIRQLKGPPSFFLLFSTIHYEKYGGFQELLNGVWDVLPKGTPLVGGTVAGFMNNYGCYSRGATALAVSYSDFDVCTGYGMNTKRNPQKAVEQSVLMIKKGFESSKYKNKFLLNFVSGPELMKIPGQGYKKVVDSGTISKFVTLAFGVSQYILQKGLGREDEILEEFTKKFPEFNMVLGASVDDYKGISNYQFFSNKFLTNAVVNLGISTDLDINVCTTHGMKKTNIKFEITRLSRNKHFIHEINNKPAFPELLRLLNWPKGYLKEKTLFNIIPYYPISVERNGKESPVVMPGILKDSIITPCIIDKGEVSILTVSGKNLVNAIKENLNCYNDIKPEFGLFPICMTIMATFGYKTNIFRTEMLNYFKEKPFLAIYCAGEGTYSPIKDMSYANMSFNGAVFGRNNGK